MSRKALQLIVAFALLSVSMAGVYAQIPATVAQKFTIRNAAGETIVLTSPSSGVTPYSLTFPPAVASSNGQVLTSSTAGVLSWTNAAAGTLTNFTAGALSPLFTTNVATPTTTPALTFNLNTQQAGKVFAGPVSGIDALPTFRSLEPSDITNGAALTRTNDANVTLTLGGSPSNALLNATSLTLGWTGLLAINRGGTNSSAAPTDGGIAYGDGAAYQFTAAGTTGQVLSSNGTGIPTWANVNSLVTGSALTDVDDANVTLTLGGTPGTSLLQPVTITAGWNGVLSTARGGTGLSTIGSAGQVLTVNAGATGLEYTTPTNGTVTNFSAGDLSPLFTTSEATTTTTPALTFNLNTQAANTVFAGPTGGGPLAPTFRALTAADIPALNYVSSVAVGNLSPLFTTSNAGTALAPSFTFSAVSQAANLVYASPSGGPGVPLFRSLTGADITGAALTKTDDANVTLTLGGTPGTALLNAASLTLGWNGLLSIARGGTNSNATPTLGGVAYGDGSAYQFTAAGTNGYVLRSNGAAAPTWVDPTSFVTGAALTETDDANIQVTLTGTPGTALLQSVNIDVDWAGILSTARGGTGLGTIGTAGQVLTVNAGATALEYTTPTNGTVTNFSAGDLSPLFTTSEATTTTTPALSFNLNAQSGNTVFASPADGSSGAPSFRSLVAADVPALPYVSSVGLALPGSVFSVSGSPVTGTGTLTGSFTSQAANTVFAAPDGSAGTPTFRALTGSDITGAALTEVDDANVTLTLGGSPSTALLNATSITAGWTGQLSIARGGTGASTAPTALNNLLPSQAGNAGEFLTTDGSGNVSWAAVTASGAWNTTGNTGTTAGTNFIGTTDNVDFVVKTNGSERVRVDATGQVGFGRSTPEATNDLDGGLIWRPDTLDLTVGVTVSGGTNIRHDNVSIGDRAYYYIYDTATHYSNRITGFTDGVNGKLLRIFNSTHTTLTLLVDDANSSVGNRIRNSVGDNGNVGISDSGFVDLIYDGETQHWIIHSVTGPTSTAASGFTYFARKTADQTLTDASHGTTLQNATGMTINIFPDIVHTCDGMFYFSSANSNVDVQIAFELTGGTADLSKITLLGHSDGGANVVDGSDIVQTNGTASATINVSGGTEMFVQVSGMFINGPSNATLQVKIKRAGGSSDLVMKQGSYLRLIPVGVD